MKRDLDLLIVIFPFEVAWYAKAAPGFPVVYVGHPLVDRIAALPPQIRGQSRQPNWIALLPGSRKTEVSHNLPILWQAAGIIAAKLGLTTLQAPFFRLLTPDETMRDFALNLLKTQPESAAPVNYEIVVGKTLDSVAPCAIALVASGTASLECTAMGVPPVVVYRVNPLTWAVGRRLANVKHLSIVNIMGDGEVVPELLQDQFTPQKVAEKAVSLLTDEPYRHSIETNMARVISDLGTPGASDRAAKLILEYLPSSHAA
jgi:lipid-A-disaccharide synthase